jgi:Na+/H+ antiporter NhaD/arsenite permease-like protein
LTGRKNKNTGFIIDDKSTAIFLTVQEKKSFSEWPDVSQISARFQSHFLAAGVSVCPCPLRQAIFPRMNHAVIAPNPWLILPFAVLLGGIALGPLLAPRWWLRHHSMVALGLGGVTLAGYFFGLRAGPRILATAHEYASFIALIGSLFVVSGGIHVRVKGRATPGRNVLFLLTGALLANVLGTTGAAMLLIRPWIRMNQHRVTAHHIVFFIFIVANVGGCLTPIGDPPLFLGYLQGVPFWWVAKNCWPMWSLGVGLLLAMFYVVDKINFARRPKPIRETETAHETWQFSGLSNLFFLAVILGAVFVETLFVREALMVAAAFGSYFTTQKSVHAANHFNFHPLQEVAVLFAGIFATMMPALDWLGLHAKEILGATPSPAIFYWGAGGLSAVLDNAPTYLGFLSALSAVTGIADASEMLGAHGLKVIAISIGAVFFGAATYIGNGPNFMVKAIADEQKIPMPTFLEFLSKYTLFFLLPVLLVAWLVFFHT